MPYTQPFVITTVEGFFGNAAPGIELWRAGWKIPVSAGDIPAPAELLAYCTAIATPVTSFHTTPLLGAGSTSKFAAVSAAVVGTDGKYLGGGAQETVRYTLPTPAAGAGTVPNPFDRALTISLRTTNSRGRASRGRFYWPATTTGVDLNDGLITVANQATYAAAARVLIDAINGVALTHLGVNNYVSVMSPLGTGTTATVASVSIGRKIDHMSSRTRNQSEAHVWVDLQSTREAAATARERTYELVKAEARASETRT